VGIKPPVSHRPPTMPTMSSLMHVRPKDLTLRRNRKLDMQKRGMTWEMTCVLCKCPGFSILGYPKLGSRTTNKNHAHECCCAHLK
jgi:hypothetical protein